MHRNNSIAGLSLLLLLISVSPIKAEISGIEESFSEIQADIPDDESLRAEKSAAIENKKTRITIRSNAPHAEVYLDGQFEGNTDLTIYNIQPGRYRLRVEKRGYETRHFSINVREGQSDTFFVELREYNGIVTFRTDPEDCNVYIDGTRETSSQVKLPEGEHLIRATAFGYESEEKTIFVHRRTFQAVTIVLQEADFDISAFRTNRTAFNPNIRGSSGEIKFYFYVTNNGSATLKIKNESNEEICSFELSGFKTWNQELAWNGSDSTGAKISDGTYTAELHFNDEILTSTFTADSSIVNPYASITAGGSGIGTLPAAFLYPQATTLFSVSGGIALKTEGDIFFASPLTFAICTTPLSFMELSARAGFMIDGDENPYFFSGAMKAGFRKKFKDCEFDFCTVLRAGIYEENPWEPYGADTGSGAGGGFAAGLKAGKWYNGISSEFTARTVDGIFSAEETDFIWRNGFASQFQADNWAAGIYAALNSSFNSSGNINDKRDGTDFLRALETGFDICIQPYTDIFINIRTGVLIFSDTSYIKADAGITFLL